MDDYNSAKNNKDYYNLDDDILEIAGYECLWCGHEQPVDGICENCGSYALESFSSESEYDFLNEKSRVTEEDE